jgi:hypothetical protein
MSPVLSAGLLIGVLCGVWTFVMGFTGWYRDPVMLSMFFVVILIELGGLYWGLKQTAAQGRGYGQQLVAGIAMSVIAGLVIIGSSLLFTTVAFPNYFQELEAMQRQQLAAGGSTPAEIEAAVQAQAVMATPMMNALAGFIGTVITGIIGSAIIAIFVKAPAARAKMASV